MKLNLPSPLEKIHLNNKVGAIYIKRDDLIHPLISGNKWRKLKGIVERFNGEQIITYGGAFSNHLLAVANYAHLKGLTSKGYIRGKELNSDNPTLSECIKFGMKLVFMDREEYRELTSTLQFNTLDFNKEQLIIPEGGTTPFVKIGMKDLVDEIKIQLNSINPLHVFCSYGTGGTSLGIGMNLKKEDHLTIVPAIKGLDEIAIEKKQQELKCSFSNYSLKYYEGMKNYAAKDLELFQFCEDFLTTTR